MSKDMTKVVALATGYTPQQKDEMLRAFPLIDPGLRPFGNRILVQIRTPKDMSEGGIALIPEAQETEKWNTQVGLVISMGPLAFRDRDTRELWPEGEWCKAGDFVRVPKYGGDSFEVKDGDNKALFKLFNDLSIGGLITINPLDVIAYFD